MFNKFKPRVGGDRTRLDDGIDLFDFQEHKKQFVQLRFVGPVKGAAYNFIKLKKKDGNIGAAMVLAQNYDPNTDSFTDKKCPYTEKGFTFRRYYFANAIIRELQEDEPRKKAPHTKKESKKITEDGFSFFPKEKDSRSWTPVRVVRLPASLMQQLQALKDLNRVKSKKTGEVKNYDIDHPKYGIDVNVLFDPDQKGGAMYNVQKAERTPITEDELEYLYYSLSGIKPNETLEEATQNATRLAKMAVDDDGEPLFASDGDEDEDDLPKKKKKKVVEDDDEFDEELDVEESPKKKKKKITDDEDDDFDDLDEEKPPKKKKKKIVEDDDEFDDDEDEDEDDDYEDDLPPKKKKKKKIAKDDDYEDDEDDDF